LGGRSHYLQAYKAVLVLHERKSRVTLATRLMGKTAAETISVMLGRLLREGIFTTWQHNIGAVRCSSAENEMRVKRTANAEIVGTPPTDKKCATCNPHHIGTAPRVPSAKCRVANDRSSPMREPEQSRDGGLR
jgi:hypothetical protein